jgi:hypothetical protein
MKKYIVSTNVGDVQICAESIKRVEDELVFFVDEELMAAFTQWNYWKKVDGDIFFRCDECKKYPELPQITDMDFDWKNGRAHK